MSKPKVSVIIPVYNTESYVTEALRSIQEQTLRELEIIVVDDGSTDQSAAIIETLAAEDPRIRFIRQPNQGQSVARNEGLKTASGEFIYFMDSDDLLEADALELCYRKCTTEQLDFVFFDALSFGDTQATASWFDYHRANRFEDRVYTGADLLRQMLTCRIYRCSICLNLISREFMERIGVHFHAGIIHEDELFSAILYLEAHRVGRIDREFFHRRLRGSSTMTTTFSSRNLTGYTTVLAELHAYAHKLTPELKPLIRQLTAYILNPTLRNAWQLPAHDRWTLGVTALFRHTRSIDAKSLLHLLFKAPLKNVIGR